jgi:hypothetical protein
MTEEPASVAGPQELEDASFDPTDAGKSNDHSPDAIAIDKGPAAGVHTLLNTAELVRNQSFPVTVRAAQVIRAVSTDPGPDLMGELLFILPS